MVSFTVIASIVLLFSLIGLKDIVMRLYRTFLGMGNEREKSKDSREIQRIVIGEDVNSAKRRLDNDPQRYRAPAFVAAIAGAAYANLHSDSDFDLQSNFVSGSELDLNFVDDISDPSTHHYLSNTVLGVNPATGLPMMSESIDVAGNPYGTDLSHDFAAHDLTMGSDSHQEWSSSNDWDTTNDWSSGSDWDSHSSSDTHDWS